MRIYLLIFYVIALLFNMTVIAEEEAGRIPGLEIPKAKGPFSDSQQCVEPLDVIRSQHGSLLKRQRNATMRQGIRTEKHSFVGCIDCHVTPDDTGNYPSIETSDHFCNSCHTYAAVHVDCFDCHATKPDTSTPPMASQEKVENLGLTVSQLLDPHTPNKAGHVIVLEVIENSPAALQGMQQGDIITHVNGKPVVGQKLTNVVNSLRGATVELTLKQGTESRTMTITKQ